MPTWRDWKESLPQRLQTACCLFHVQLASSRIAQLWHSECEDTLAPFALYFAKAESRKLRKSEKDLSMQKHRRHSKTMKSRLHTNVNQKQVLDVLFQKLSFLMLDSRDPSLKPSGEALRASLALSAFEHFEVLDWTGATKEAFTCWEWISFRYSGTCITWYIIFVQNYSKCIQTCIQQCTFERLNETLHVVSFAPGLVAIGFGIQVVQILIATPGLKRLAHWCSFFVFICLFGSFWTGPAIY